MLAYHFVLAKAAEVAYRYPSSELIVIGVTGTNGKSSTVNFIAQLLAALGEKVGYTSTAGFMIAGEEVANRMKMTMPGRFALQRLLRRMVVAECRYAVVETSSQGIAQYRHLGVNYDVAVFTNLTPEHIESHGGFANYKAAKGELFRHLTARARKTIDGKRVAKVIVANADDEHAEYFLAFSADRTMRFGWDDVPDDDAVMARLIERNADGAMIDVNGLPCQLKLFARYEWQNAIAAITAVTALGFSLDAVVRAAQTLKQVPGRFEWIRCGQPFAVIVDYAYEPYALAALYDAIAPLGFSRVIGVHGSAGGGRDAARRPQIGKLAAERESIVIVTNEDPYDEDPKAIIEAVAVGSRKAGKRDGHDLFVIENRAEAIDKAIGLAAAGDVVLVTGKGSEPVMAVAGGTVPWDDREAARHALAKRGFV